MVALLAVATLCTHGQSATPAAPEQSPGAAIRAKPSLESAEVAKLPDWDVVSVRRADPNVCAKQGGGLQFNADGVRAFCVLPLAIVEAAYQIADLNRIVGAPDWTKTGNGWNIDAKVAEADIGTFTKLAPKDKDRMLLSLMDEYFHLKAHLEKREMPVYDLVVAKAGSKLKEASAEDSARAFMGMRQQGKIEAVGMQLASLSWMLNREAGRPVVDKTGLTGKYDFTLEFVPVAKVATDETGGPSIFTALEEQLGLKLEPAKEPTDVVVIDSIEQPAAN